MTKEEQKAIITAALKMNLLEEQGAKIADMVSKDYDPKRIAGELGIDRPIILNILGLLTSNNGGQ